MTDALYIIWYQGKMWASLSAPNPQAALKRFQGMYPRKAFDLRELEVVPGRHVPPAGGDRG